MTNKILQKISKRGLFMIGLLLFVGLLVVATQSPAVAMAGAAIPMVFGTVVGADTVSNLRTLKYTHSAALEPGDPIVVNGALLVAVNTSAANAENVFIYQGKVTIAKEAPLVINALDAVYWVAASSHVNKTSGGNTACGYCVEAAASAATTVTIMLMPNVAILDLSQTSQNSITDPGDAGAIPVTASGVVQIVTAGAETRTLAAPSFIGQTLEICMKTDGGDGVITCATTVNQTGNNTITLNDAGDCVTLIAKQNGANLRWSVLANDGATLSTV